MTPESDANFAPLPAAPPPAPEPPKESWLKVLLGQRFLLIALVIFLFLGILFGLGKLRGVKPPAEGHPAAAPEAHPAAKAAEAPKPSAPPEAARAPEPGKEPVHPAPPPPAAPPREPVKGEIFTQGLIKIIDHEVNQRFFGWRPNTIIFGKTGLTDNVNNLQLGVLEVARRTILVLNENLTRFAITEAYNPRVNEAMNFLMVSPDKYWFPSASGKYREAVQDLQLFIQDLKVGRSRFYTRVDNLIALLAAYKDILGSSFHNLLKDAEADGKPVSWFMADDYFYHAQGVAIGMSHMLEAVKDEFRQELQKKNAHKLMEDAIHALHTASHLSPWVITNGAKDGILANHRANMSTYIGEAEHLVATMQTMLATN